MGIPDSSEKKASTPKTKTAKALTPATPAKKIATAPKAAAKGAPKSGAASKNAAPAPLAPPPAPSFEDIALRAYFIGEKRQQLSLPGDSEHDWVEAERQLLEEAKAKKPVRKKASA